MCDLCHSTIVRTPSEISLEPSVRRELAAGDVRTAGLLVANQLGQSIFTLLVLRIGDEDLAAQAFCEVVRALWAVLPGLGAQTVRVVALATAQRVAERVARDLQPRHIAADEAQASQCRPRLRLSADDRLLLLLRVHQKLTWKQTATVVWGVEPDAGPAMRRSAARLRKRFERVRARLAREVGAREGGAR